MSGDNRRSIGVEEAELEGLRTIVYIAYSRARLGFLRERGIERQSLSVAVMANVDKFKNKLSSFAILLLPRIARGWRGGAAAW